MLKQAFTAMSSKDGISLTLTPSPSACFVGARDVTASVGVT